MDRKCKRCSSAMVLISLESNDDNMFHTHYVCLNSDTHPYYCCQERRYIGS